MLIKLFKWQANVGKPQYAAGYTQKLKNYSHRGHTKLQLQLQSICNECYH